MDVVIPLKPGQKQYDKLRYCLRGLEKYLTDLGDVYVCGGRPTWLRGAKLVPTVEWFLDNRDANTIDAVLAACAAGVGKQFLHFSDFNVLLAPVKSSDLVPSHGDDVLAHEADDTWNTRWKLRVLRTARYLRSRGLPSLFFDTHAPNLHDRDEFVRVMRAAPYTLGDGLTIETLYHNSAAPTTRRRVGAERLLTRPGDPIEATADHAHVVIAAFDEHAAAFLYQRFPVPSRFEKA
jgi:hypothetical protein